MQRVYLTRGRGKKAADLQEDDDFDTEEELMKQTDGKYMVHLTTCLFLDVSKISCIWNRTK